MTHAVRRAARAALTIAVLAAAAPAAAAAEDPCVPDIVPCDPVAIDVTPPATVDNVPLTAIYSPVPYRVTLTALDGDGSGVDRTYYTLDGSEPTTSSAVYDPDDRPWLQEGQRIRYFSVDRAGNVEEIRTSSTLRALTLERGGTPPPPPPPPGDPATAAPTGAPAQTGQAALRQPIAWITGLSVGPRCFRAPRPGRRASLALRYSLVDPASVRFTIVRTRATAGRRCAGSGPVLARVAARGLSRLRLTRRGKAGRNVARVGAGRLRPGTYRVRAYAEAPSGQRSPVAEARFRIVRR